MAKVIVKTDNFAKRIIKNGDQYKKRSLFRMAAAARNELRNVVRKRKKSSAPGKAPSDHGTYRNTALFSVDSNGRGFEAGFADYKSDKKSLVLGNQLAQDVLEFGGTITRAVIYKNRKKNAKKESFNIKPRPHVFVARERLFKGSTKNQKRFLKAQQDLIDRGYLK